MCSDTQTRSFQCASRVLGGISSILTLSDSQKSSPRLNRVAVACVLSITEHPHVHIDTSFWQSFQHEMQDQQLVGSIEPHHGHLPALDTGIAWKLAYSLQRPSFGTRKH